MGDERSRHFFIEFAIGDTSRFAGLEDLLRALRREKEIPAELRGDVDWSAFLDDEARRWFSDFVDPDSDYGQLFLELWKLTSPKVRLSSSMFVQPGHWDFESTIDAILSCECDLADIICEEAGRGKLFYMPLAGPFGGTESLVELVEAFGNRVTFDSWHSGPHRRVQVGWDPKLARELVERGEGFTEECTAAAGRLHLSIASVWNSIPAGASEFTSLWLSSSPDGGVRLEVDAPLHGDPAPEAPAGSFDRLWNHEVVELFISGPGEQYLEVELGPHGHHLVLEFDGVRQRSGSPFPLAYIAHREGDRWRGEAALPVAYLPEGPHRVNAFAVHGKSPRRFLAHSFVPGEKPDFHQPNRFVPVEIPPE